MHFGSFCRTCPSVPFDVSSLKFIIACREDVAAQTDFIKILLPLSKLKPSEIDKVGHD